MDWLTFVASIIGSLAWPVTTLVIIAILYRPLINLFPSVQRLRFQGLELDFDRQVHALAFEARTLLPRARGVLDAEITLRAQWVELANFSPRAVVLEAWIQLEKAAIEASRRHGLNLKTAERNSPLLLGQALEEAGVFEGNTGVVFHQLRNLRNAAAHASEFSFTPDSAIEYADLATRLTEYLSKA
jgi:hypothetical protein